MASGYGTCAEGTPELMGAVSVNGDGVWGGGKWVSPSDPGYWKADALVFFLCKNALVQHLLLPQKLLR